MNATFIICVGYASAAILYLPNGGTLLAWFFISMSAAPLLLAGRASFKLPKVEHRPPTMGILIVGISVGFLNLIVIAQRVGYSVADLFDATGWFLIAAESTTIRYTEQGSSGSPWLLSLSLALVYWVGAASPRLKHSSKVFSFLPLLFYSLLSTEKWPTFLGGAFYISGLFAGQTEGKALLTMLRLLVVFGVLGFGLAGLALILRGFEGDISELPAQIFHYILAPFPALGQWLLVGSGVEAWGGLGGFTFIGPASQLGLMQRDAGVYIDNVSVYGLETNIYTAWRYLIEDFSIIGPAVINLTFALTFLLCLDLKLFGTAHLLRSFLVLCSTLSLAVTPFVHNSVALATVLVLTLTLAQLPQAPLQRALRATVRLH